MHNLQQRAHWLGAPQFFNLNRACCAVDQAFGGACTYLVGSSLERRDYRDVDVRVILDDEHYDRLFPGLVGHNEELHPLWSVMCASIVLYLSQHSGLPIDFQIQRRTQANERYPMREHPRNAVGIFLSYNVERAK
jgi:hypothetical protein